MGHRVRGSGLGASWSRRFSSPPSCRAPCVHIGAVSIADCNPTPPPQSRSLDPWADPSLPHLRRALLQSLRLG